MKYFYLIIFGLFFVKISNAQIKYVSQDGAGTKDGSSWANAWSGEIFADTIYSVTSGTQVWVAKGTYIARKDTLGNFPVAIINPGDSQEIHRETTFKIPSGVKLYGGFAGTETVLSQRVDSLIFGTNLTYFEGSYLPQSGNPSDWSGNLITMENVNDSTMLDGFYLADSWFTSIYIHSKGDNSSSPIVQNCLFGIVYNFAYAPVWISSEGTLLSTPKLYNCYFTGGAGAFGSGGILAEGNNKFSLANSVFIYCKGDQGNCIAINFNKGANIDNCTFYNNLGTVGNFYSNSYGAICTRNVTGIVNISNSIFYNNQSYFGGISNLYETGGNFYVVKNCNFQQQDPAYSVEPAIIENSINIDPQFKDVANIAGADNTWFTSDDGLGLLPGSPCINTGLNDKIPDFITTDILRKSRVAGCRVDMGAYEANSNYANSNTLPTNNYQVCTQYPVAAAGNTYIDTASCSPITAIVPSGTNPISGIIKVCVNRIDTVPVISGIPYVQRFYDIEPLVNPSATTSSVTLYYTQEEFDNYNLVAGGFPKLPVSASDASGIANIKIEQDHEFSLTGEPGTYSGATVYINPDDYKIVWNVTASRWEITFDVTGFSGFFISTAVNVLPVTLVDFFARENNGAVTTYWNTSTEINTSYFEIQRSRDGVNFSKIGKVNALNYSNGAQYNFKDINPNTGANYYRLVIVDDDGKKKYSAVIVVTLNNFSEIEISVAPNPAVKNTNISVTGKLNGKINIQILDINGRKVADVFEGKVTSGLFKTNLNVEQLPKGLYIICCSLDNKIIRQKLIVQ
jgi:Secretion system C-terminal sorting domain